MEKIKVFNNSKNQLPAESTPFSAAKDIRVSLELVSQKFIFDGLLLRTSKTEVSILSINELQEMCEREPKLNDNLGIVLYPNGRVLFPSGLKMEIPDGYSLDVRPRSGLSLKFGLEIVNSPGLIDADYRGDVGVIIKNGSSKPVLIIDGERIAQIKLVKDVPFEWESVEDESDLSPTVRGSGGFNSTGTK